MFHDSETNIEFEDNAPRRKYLVKPYGIDAKLQTHRK